MSVVSGASLAPAGRRTFARGAALLSIAFTSVALFDTANAHAGALGNTGSVSQAALTGAALSAFLVFDAFGPWTLVHAAALLLHLVYAWSVPVHAGVLALGAALAALALLRTERRPRVAWALLALVAVLGALAPRFLAREKGEHASGGANAGPRARLTGRAGVLGRAGLVRRARASRAGRRHGRHRGARARVEAHPRADRRPYAARRRVGPVRRAVPRVPRPGGDRALLAHAASRRRPRSSTRTRTT